MRWEKVNPTRVDSEDGWFCWYCHDRDQQDIARRNQEDADKAKRENE